MNKKPDRIVRYIGYFLMGDSAFVLGMFILGTTIHVSMTIPTILAICGCGILMGFLGFWLVKNNPPLITSGEER